MKMEYNSKFNIGDRVFYLQRYNEWEWFCEPKTGEITEIKLSFSKDWEGKLCYYCEYEIVYDVDQHYNRIYSDSNVSESDVFNSVEEFNSEMKNRNLYSDGVTFKY